MVVIVGCYVMVVNGDDCKWWLLAVIVDYSDLQLWWLCLRMVVIDNGRQWRYGKWMKLVNLQLFRIKSLNRNLNGIKTLLQVLICQINSHPLSSCNMKKTNTLDG